MAIDTTNLTAGIDTSYYNEGRIDWADAKAHGIMFGVARCVDGDTKDIQYDRDTNEMVEHAVLPGDYLTFYNHLDPIMMAHKYYDSSKKTLALSPQIDLEKRGITIPMTVKVLQDRTLVCIKELAKLFGFWPIIYTGLYDWRDLWGAPDWGKDSFLWLAQYRNYLPTVPLPWTKWTFWQFASTYWFGNQYSDGNYFNGTYTQLLDWVKTYKGVIPPQPTPEQRITVLEIEMREVKAKLGLL